MARKRFFRGGKQVRQTMWIGVGASNTTLASANTVAQINILNAAALALRPFTVIRTRGTWVISSDQSATTENFQAALGCCIVSDQASAIGVTAIPTPFTDQGSDLFYVYEMAFGRLSSADATGQLVYSSVNYDSKAMRKVNDDQDINFVIESSGLSAGVQITHSARILLKLH